MTMINKVLTILTGAEKRRFAKLAVIILVMGLFEILGVASILPFMQLVADPDAILANPYMQRIVETFGFTRTRQLVLWSGGIVVGLILVTNLFTIYANWFQYSTVWKLVDNLSNRLMAGYLRRPYAFFLTTPTNRLSAYILSEVTSFASGVAVPMIEIVGRSTVALVILAMLVWVDPTIALVMFGTLGGAYALIYLFQRQPLIRLGRERMEANVQRYRALREVFDGVKTVKAYNREGFFYDHFSAASRRFTTLQPKYQVLTAAPKNILEVLAFGTIIGITIYLFLNRGNFAVIVPTLSLYAVAGYRLLPALQKAFKALGSIRHNQPIVDKIHDSVVNASNSDDFSREIHEPLPLRRELVLEDLSFRYEEAELPALKGVSLRIAAGETVAFVGTTGSGKTTLIDIIVGLLEPESGTIRVDDTALTAENVAGWRTSVAYVPQDVFLFDDSILRNVTIGAAAGAEEVMEALDLADIGAFVRGLPEGLETRIGEKGVRLSGGQRQRLGLARALLTHPSVLILDEATSALDNVTERGIIDALANLPRDITTVVIAHRLSTVQHADRIYFLEHGEVKDQGSYEELKGANAAFAAMANHVL